jgi:hypothetical protein
MAGKDIDTEMKETRKRRDKLRRLQRERVQQKNQSYMFVLGSNYKHYTNDS